MKPGKEFAARYKTAQEWRQAVRPDLEECLSYCCPGRELDFSTNNKTPAQSQRFISIGEELAADLAGDLVTYYTPAEVKWAEYMVTAEIPEEAEDAVLALVQAREDQFSDLISASNYNDVAPAGFFEAASHGTIALWVQKSHLTQPIHFEVIQPHQLLITPGHLGYLDRFREATVGADTLEALFQGWKVDLSDFAIQAKIKKPGQTCKVVWGFWLDWSDPGNPKWSCEITVDGKRITPDTPIDLGPMAGSCPLLVGRFNPQSGKPWGRGPGIRALPDLRVTNEIADVVMSGLDQALTNTVIYADDGSLDLSEGIEAGRAYPASARFNRDQIFMMPNAVNVDQAYFTEEKQEAKLRRTFYQDGPRQRGDTPPTAEQWVDERRRVQQRLGKPSAPLWSELILSLVQRVEYLAVQSKLMPEAITHDGNSITVMPISPLQKAQNQDKVMIARSNLNMAVGILGDQAGAVVDMVKTMKNIVKTSGDDLTVVKDEQDAPPAAAAPQAGAPA